jgi:hypothetical protein
MNFLLYPPRDVPVAQSGAYYRKFITSAFVEIQQRSQRARKELSQLSTLAGGQDVPPDGTFFFTTHNGLVLSPAELEDVMSEGQAPHRILLVITFVSYTDSYGGDYTTETCAQFWGNNDFKIWHICDAFNVIR